MTGWEAGSGLVSNRFRQGLGPFEVFRPFARCRVDRRTYRGGSQAGPVARFKAARRS
jgi:hypothetical protein